MNHITLVRHAENRDHAAGIFNSTNPDDTLTEQGRAQAQATAAHLAGQDVAALYASPLPRARQTAAVIGDALGLTVNTLAGLREVDVGALSGERADERAWKEWSRVLGAWEDGRVTTQFPGGETYVALWDRMRGAVETIVEGRDDQHIVAVMHGGILRATLKDLCPGSNVEWYRRFPIDNGAVIRVQVEWRSNRVMGPSLHGTLIEWASTDHLNGAR